jgi:hypothetical protein
MNFRVTDGFELASSTTLGRPAQPRTPPSWGSAAIRGNGTPMAFAVHNCIIANSADIEVLSSVAPTKQPEPTRSHPGSWNRDPPRPASPSPSLTSDSGSEFTSITQRVLRLKSHPYPRSVLSASVDGSPVPRDHIDRLIQSFGTPKPKLPLREKERDELSAAPSEPVEASKRDVAAQLRSLSPPPSPPPAWINETPEPLGHRTTTPTPSRTSDIAPLPWTASRVLHSPSEHRPPMPTTPAPVSSSTISRKAQWDSGQLTPDEWRTSFYKEWASLSIHYRRINQRPNESNRMEDSPLPAVITRSGQLSPGRQWI